MELNNYSNKMISRFALAAIMALAGTALQAESLPIHASIPFAFLANGNVMPAGEYSIKPMSGVAGAVVLRSETGVSMIALTQAASDSTMKSKIVFAEAERGKALESIVAPGWMVMFKVPAPVKVAKRMEVPGIAAIARAR